MKKPKDRLSRMVKLLAARRCREAGQSVKQIATSAQVSTGTVYQWLKHSGYRRQA